MGINPDSLPEMVQLKEYPEVYIPKERLIEIYSMLQSLMDSRSISHLLAFHELATAVHTDHIVVRSQPHPDDPITILHHAGLIDGVTDEARLVIPDDIRWIVFAGTYPSEGSYNLRSIQEVIQLPG